MGFTGLLFWLLFLFSILSLDLQRRFFGNESVALDPSVGAAAG